MRIKDLLPEIMATMTQKPRYEVISGRDFVWSEQASVSRIFRLWEIVAGRRADIRPESSSGLAWDEKGTLLEVHQFHTLEAVLAHIEMQVVRKFFKTFRLPKIAKVYLPQLAPAAGFNLPSSSPYLFAIAFTSNTASQTNSTAGTTSVSYSLTVSGSNASVFEGGYNYVSIPSGITFNSSAGTLVKNYSITGNAPIHMFYKTAPTTGTVVLTLSGGCEGITSCSSVYSGTAQTSAVLDSFGFGDGNTVSTTVVLANCWLFGIFQTDNPSGVTAGSGTTSRVAVTTSFQSTMVADSNGTVSTGSQSLVSVCSGNRGGIVASMAPFVAPAGPANVKTFDGVTQSTGIKTYLGVALASTKTVDGIA